MNKTQLIDALAANYDGNKKAAGEALDAVLDTITRAVASGEKVGITGFGVFEKVERPARIARNPATGERVKVAKTSTPRFKAGTGFKAAVAGAKKSTAKKAAPAKKAAAKKAAPAKRVAKKAAR
jgi:DNA-binding protein HU-beta